MERVKIKHDLSGPKTDYKKLVVNVAIFASGSGTNAVNLFHYFQNHPSIRIFKIYCNNPKAGIIDKAKDLGLECRVFDRDEWKSGIICKELNAAKTDFIILAGFLWLVPSQIIKSFPDKIINIHPALLPNFGGKGMYGMKVHETVIAEKEKESGITIHLVNEEYDKGEILLQKKIAITENETPSSLASKIHELEYQFFPKTVEKYINEFKEKGR